MRLLKTLVPVTCVFALLLTIEAPAASVAGRLAAAARKSAPENEFCRLYLDPHDKFTRVLSDQEQLNETWGSLAWMVADANTVTANITVNYVSGFTGTTGAAAQAAFQAAVDIWKTQVTSTVPIVIDADFKDLGGSSGPGVVLGSAGSGATVNYPGAPRRDTFFPFPLANKLAGSDIGAQFFGAGSSNITAHFNNNLAANWSFATDGTTVAGKVDFESVVLHELGHGLGFLGGSKVDGAGQGTIGARASDGVIYSYIYDTFAVDAATGGNPLINTGVYPNPSAALGSTLTSNVYWDGNNGKSANGNVRPKLFTPSTFSQGSTFSHLDENTYPTTSGHPNINSLMTPFIGSAEVIHTPGPVVLGMFADMGWGSQTGTSCSYALDHSASTVASTGGTVSVTLSTTAGCNWTASVSGSFITISPAGTGSGSQVFSIVVAANTAASQRTSTVSIGGQTLTVTQFGTGPLVSLDKTSLIYTAVSNGAQITATTAPQAVRLTQTGTGSVTWTASSNVSWLSVSPASGSGSATLTITATASPTLPATQAGAITLTFTGAGNSAGPIAATLNLENIGAATAPIGAFDTPTDNSTGVTGSIAVTGWAVDDVEVTRVRILRDPVAGEPAGVLVPIGNAVLVDGARTDVQALYPTLPRSSRAGWGYLMLTNFLPNLGNGTFKLTAIADDAEGHSTVLGTKTITCTNSSATAPFGAIDTPDQGATVSGNVTNFGWVLSKGPARSDPPSGGTVRVVIDGAIVSNVPGGWTNRPDLTALFPALQFPGIATALGVAAFDSTTLTNGVHTISWVVTDNQSPAGASGIGSRYFTVANGALRLDPDGLDQGASAIEGSATLVVPRAAAARMTSAGSLADEVDAAAPDTRAIVGRRGYDVTAPLRSYGARAGVTTVQSEELDRIELHLSQTAGHNYSGYVRGAAGLAPLPIGSALTPSNGTFTWQPGVGFVGRYDLVFVRWSGGRAVSRQDVRIVLNPRGSNRVGPQVVIDTPRQQQDVAQPFVIAGWAADLDSTIDGGVDAVHVWAYPLAGGDPIFIGPAAIGGARPDVAAVYGERFGRSGYGIQLKGLEPGNYDIAVFAYSTVTGGFVPAKTVRLTVR